MIEPKVADSKPAQKRSAKKSFLRPLLEKFSRLVAEGHTHVEAAIMCDRAPGSASSLYARPEVKKRIAELMAIAETATEKAVAESAAPVWRSITIDRNDIIMGLADIGLDPKANARARVAAWSN